MQLAMMLSRCHQRKVTVYLFVVALVVTCWPPQLTAAILNTGTYEVTYDTLSGPQVMVADSAVVDSPLKFELKGANAIKPPQGFAELSVDSVAEGDLGSRRLRVRAKVEALANPAAMHTDFWTDISMESNMTARLIDQITPSSPGATDMGTVKFVWQLEGEQRVARQHIPGRNFGFYEVAAISANTNFSSTLTGELFDETVEPGAGMFPLRDAFDLPQSYPPPPLGLIEVDVPVTFGQPTDVVFALHSEVSFRMRNLDGGDNFDVIALADFGNSATLTLVEVFDANGVKLTGATIESQAGIDYLGPLVPEPSSNLLAILGLVLLVAASYGRRRRRPLRCHRVKSL